MNMAFDNKTILVVAILVASVLVTSAQGQFGAASVDVEGGLFCTDTGNPTLECLGNGSCPVITGAIISLKSPTGTIASAMTNSTGGFVLRVNLPVGIITSLTNFNVTTPLPVQNCTLLPTSGNLTAAVQIESVTSGPNIGSLSVNCGIGVWSIR